MEILYTSDYLIVKKPQFSLWFKRYETVSSFEFKTGIDFSKFGDLKCLGIGYALIGALKQDSLLFAVRNQFVGQLPSDQSDLNVHLIKRAAIVDLHSDLDALIANELFDNCPVHALAIPSQSEPQPADNLSAQTMQKTWNTIKSTAGLMTANTNFSLNDEILKLFNETDSFFYAENGDLTNSLQRKNTSQYLELCSADAPYWQRADDRFFFNRHLLSFLIDRATGQPQLANFIVPIMQGFVQIEDCKISMEETNEFRLILISRRSRYHAGTRFKRRGVDENGRCANYVETEQILKCAKHTVSFVQVRGSIPVFWSQPGLAYRPTPVLDRTMAESQAAFRKHFEQEIGLYDAVIAVSLIERNGRESIVGDAYLNCVLEFDSEKLSYVIFDFNNKCRGMKFGNVNLLIDSVQEQIKEMLFFWKDADGVICRQNKVFRINCIDCLDRTNLVQSAIAKFVLLTQMNKLALLAPDCQLPFNCRKAFQQLWANNGDCISRQYAGTKALKGDYTRLGERRFTGVMKDSYNSASRYYINRFKDAYRQAAIDTVLGNQIDLPDLAELSDQNNNEAEEDSERIKQIIEDVKMFCIPENEIILGSWALVSSTNDEMDSILVLCKDGYHVASYDEARDRVTKCQCVLLEDIEKIELGPEPNLLFSSNKNLRQSYAIRINYLFNQTAGYFHMFRSSNTRFFNNMAIPVKTSEDAIESLRSIAESFKVALSVKNISVPIFEGKLVAKKSKKPTTMYFAKKMINQQLQRLPRNISDNNLLRFKNVGKSALNNVSSQFARFKGKFTGSTRSNINLPEIYECDTNDLRNNSCTSLSIVAEDNMDYVKTSLKPRLTDPSTIASSSSIALYTTEEELAERTLSSEFSSTEEDLEDEDEEDIDSSSYQNDEEYSKSLLVDPNDTLLESCGILHSTSKHQAAARPKSETGLYASSDEVDDFVFDSMKKNSLNQMLSEVKRKACSPKIQITSQQEFRSSDFRSSDCFLNTTRNLDNSVSCANLNTGKENRTSSLGETEAGDLAGTSPIAVDEQDCTRSTMDIYSSNKKRNQLSSPMENRIKSSKSETPLNDPNLSSTSRLATIGKRDLLFNPLTKIGNIGRGLQNISLISRRYNKSLLMSTEELEQLAERKSRSKSMIVEIE